jgi:biopolymer transport protein ExbB
MKKLIRIGIFASLIASASLSFAVADTKLDAKDSAKTEQTSVIKDSSKTAVAESAIAKEEVSEEPKVEKEWHQVIKEKMVEGGVEFMGIILLCLILGLTIAIERVITLNLATTNTKKLLNTVKEKLFGSGIDDAREAIADVKGPIAGIFAQGLLRLKNGESTGDIENSIVNHGSAEMSKLEKGLSWINLFISLAPMFGFMGTVIGMIQAFDMIQTSGEMEIGSVAGGIKVALITTVGGLIVAIILQIFYNYCVSKIEDLSSEMEDSSNSFMDMISKYKREKGV